MDRTSQEPQQRDMVYCHQCENEWYRDEHGLTCPECHSDFTEIIEADHDPRADEQHIPADTPGTRIPHQRGEFYGAPDPDEEDIDNLGWRQSGPGGYPSSANRTFNMQPGQQQQQGQGGGLFGGLLGTLGNMLQGAMEQQGQQQAGQQGQQQGFGQQPRPQSPDGGQARSASLPGTARGGTNVRHIHGPNFHMSIMTSGGGGGNLFPRNANGPQPHQQQPDQLEQMIAQMMMNIGPMGAGGQQGGMHMGGPGVFGMHDPAMGGMGGMGGAGPFGNLFQMMGMPGMGGGGQFGDAVFTQEALDRIVTQLMEQHQSGNAPGPATEEAIKSLPTKQIEEKDLGENGKAECTICMDEVEIGATVTVLPCNHWFHFECIKAWLSEHDTCPHCRQGIMPRDAASADRPRQPSQAPLNDMNSPAYHGPRDMPGGFPPAFDRQESGTRDHPFTVPESPTMHRRSSSTPSRPSGSRQGSSNGGGVFRRMRDAFGGNGGPSGAGGSSGRAT